MPEPTKINRIPKTYSLDPVVIAWVTQRAARLTIEGLNGGKANDSKVVNDILAAAMDEDQRNEAHKKHLLETTLKHKRAK